MPLSQVPSRLTKRTWSSLRSSGFRQPRQADKLGTIPERVIAPRDCRQRNHLIVAEGLQMRLTAQKLREACNGVDNAEGV